MLDCSQKLRYTSLPHKLFFTIFQILLNLVSRKKHLSFINIERYLRKLSSSKAKRRNLRKIFHAPTAQYRVSKYDIIKDIVSILYHKSCSTLFIVQSYGVNDTLT